MNRLTRKIVRSAKMNVEQYNDIQENKLRLVERFKGNKEDIDRYLLDYLIMSILCAADNETDLLESLEGYYKGPHIKIWIPIVPPGINATYGVNCKSRQKVYKTKEAKQWEKDAIMPIRSAANSVGFVVDPKKDKLIISIVMQGSGHDVDAPIKMIVDTVARTLCFDDKIVTNVHSSIDREHPERGVLIEVEKEIL